jgi:hypothetical protein
VGFRRIYALSKNPSPLEKAATKIPAKYFRTIRFVFSRFFVLLSIFSAIEYQDFSSFIKNYSFFNDAFNFMINVNGA